MAEGDEAQGLTHEPRKLVQHWTPLPPPSFAHQPILDDQPAEGGQVNRMAWSATSSMNVSGTFVTGTPRAVAAATSTESTPTLPSAITWHRSRPSMMRLVIGRTLA